MDIYKMLIEYARKRHGKDIVGCCNLPFSKCFQVVRKKLLLYYNDAKTGSTHVVVYNSKTKLIEG